MILGLIFIIIAFIFRIYYYSIILYFISSWFPSFRESKFIQFIGKYVEPYLSFFRKFIPPVGIIDISSIIALVVFGFIEGFALEGLRALLLKIYQLN